METLLHKQLKEMYCGKGARMEVPLGGYRIDVIRGDELVEIQHGSLAAIRDKTAVLLKAGHRVLVVKPVIARKRLIKLAARGGKIVSQRYSPKRGDVFDLFDDLVYFTKVFPHKRLAIETLLVEVEELRFPGHGKRRRWRINDFQVESQRLVEVQRIHRFNTTDDLLRLLPSDLPKPFSTADLAQRMDIERGVAQRIAYCLREMGAVSVVGRRSSGWQYELQSEKAA